MSQIEILQDIDLQGTLSFLQNNTEFPSNPKIGSVLVKDQCLFAYIKIGGMETWYPFASKTSSYVHVQGMESLTWVINHGLQTTDVWTQVKDQQGNVINATVNVIDINTIHIVFTSPRLGSAVVVAPQSIDVPEVKAVSIKVDDTVIIDSSGIKVNGEYVLTNANIGQQITDAVAPKADKTYVDAELAKKADKATTYTKTEVDTAISAITGTGNIPQGYGTVAELAAQLQFDEGQIAQAQSDISDLQSNAVLKTSLGVADGVATLGGNGKIITSQLPSYVDDVLEFADLASFPTTGETGKIYVALDTNLTYRWSGSAYVKIASGEVDSVNGYKGVVTLTKSDIGLGNVENKSSATIRGEITSTNVTDALGFTPVASNAGITASTGTKITYDAKGLVTGSTTLTASDIPDLSSTYQPKNSNLTSVSGLSASATGLVKLTNGVASLDTTSYSTLVLGSTAPSNLGASAAAGTSSAAAHADHVHQFPTASQVGAEPTITAGTISQYYRGDKTWASFPTELPASDVYSWAKSVTKPSYTASEVGLGNVDNTSDVNKPVSTAQAAADATVLTQAKTYADGLVVGLWDDRGNYDASGNTFPSTGGSGASGAVLKGDIWTVSVAGTVGGVAVAVRQTLRALIDNPGQTSSNWAIGLASTDIDNSITSGVTGRAPSQDAVYQALAGKQATLVSGNSIKTINGNSLLGSGDLAVGGGSLTIQNKTAAYTVVAADNGNIINCTSGTFTVSLTAAATLGAGFNVWIWNTSATATDIITISPPSGSIDSVANIKLQRGEGVQLVCDGANWQTGAPKKMRGYAENVLASAARPVVTSDYGMALSYNSSGNPSKALSGAGAMALGGSYASGADSFAAAGADNTGTYGAQGANSVAIGFHAKSSGLYSVSLGYGPTASGQSATAIGQYASAAGMNSLAIGGYSTSAASPYSTAIGMNSSGTQGSVTASGSGAMALGGSYAAGTDSFAAAIGNNTSSYGAFGNNSIAMGYLAKASGSYSLSVGYSNLASSNYSVAVGGKNNTASSIGAYASGMYSNSNLYGKWAYASGQFSVIGDAQIYKQVLRANTTGAVATAITADGSTAGASNQIGLQLNSATSASVRVVSRDAVTGDTKAWLVDVTAKCGATASTTALVGTPQINVLAQDSAASSWTIAVTADTTNGAIAIKVTGAGSNAIHTVANVQGVEVI